MTPGHLIGFAILMLGNDTALLAPEVPTGNIIIVTTIIGFLTMIVQNVFSYLKGKSTQEQSNKDREFDARDRSARSAEILAQAKADQELVAARTAEANSKLQLLVEQRTAELKTAIGGLKPVA